MKITMRSPRTGEETTMDLDITQEQLDEFRDPKRVRLVQHIFPSLTKDECEFIKTGYTSADWDAMFPPQVKS